MKKCCKYLFCICCWQALYQKFYQICWYIVNKFCFRKRSLSCQILSILSIALGFMLILQILNYFANALPIPDFSFSKQQYWMVFGIVCGSCIFFDILIFLSVCCLVYGMMAPIRRISNIAQLVKSKSSKFTMTQELGANEDYVKVQRENREDEIGELIENFIEVLGLSERRYRKSFKGSEGGADSPTKKCFLGAEMLRPNPVTNTFYDPSILRQLGYGSSSTDEDGKEEEEEKEESEKSRLDLKRIGISIEMKDMSVVDLQAPLMNSSMVASSGTRCINISAYQHGYDPLYIDWEGVLDGIEDDPGANKYVFLLWNFMNNF